MVDLMSLHPNRFMMRVLGISSFYHDSAAALIEDGRIVAAAQEERFTRRKHDPEFPHRAIEYCLREGGVGLDELDHVVFYDKPFLKFERLLETYVAMAPRGFRSFSMAMPQRLREKLFQKSLLNGELKSFSRRFDGHKLLFCEHHLSHAASAYYPSPYDEAVVLTMDGVGEWATTSVAIGQGKNLEIIKEIHFPYSRSPTTPVSRSIRASTKLWAWRPTASRSMCSLFSKNSSISSRTDRLGSICRISIIAPVSR